MDADAAADLLEAHVRDRFQVADDDPEFGRETHLFDLGYVDSVGAAELTAWMEERFRVRIPDEILFSERATTIRGLAEIVAELSR